MTTTSVYFPGLNALRAYAALCVVIIHIPTYTVFGGFGTTLVDSPLALLALTGRDAVTLFFVLSGFLITYLLLTERERTGTISVRKFYARRALRIWPLYYATVLLGGVIFPVLFAPQFPTAAPTPFVWALVLLLMTNVPYYFQTITLPFFLAHLWSVSVEEQFYLTFPALLKRVNLVQLACAVILVKLLVSAALWILEFGGISLPWVRMTVDITRFECMAVGALGAYAVFVRHPVLTVLYRTYIQRFALVIVALVAAAGSEVRYMPLYDVVISGVFLVIIVNVATNPRSILRLEYRIFHFLGSISYGMYMLHPFTAYLVLFIFSRLGLPLIGLPLDAAMIAMAVFTASLSYYGFERPFLRLKTRFAMVASETKPPAGSQQTVIAKV